MSSRDFGFLTLRNLRAYQTNGNPVPTNQLLVTTGPGSAGFSNSLNISSIEVSTISIQVENVSTINASTINAPTINLSSINTNFLTVNSTTTLSTTIINNTLSLIGNTPSDSEIWLHNYNSRLGTSDPYGGLYLEASTTTSIWFSNINATNGPYAQIGQDQSQFYGSMNVASTLFASTLDADIISTFMINVISTLTFYDGTSSVVLDAVGSTLYVNGHPLITGGGISSVSSLFWVPGPNGTIYNENIGTGGGNYYQVGVGTYGAALKATLDVAGTTNIASSLTVSSIFNVQTINTSSISASAPSNPYFINYTQNIDGGAVPYPVLRFNSLKNGGTENKSLTLKMGDGVAIWSSEWEGYLMQDMQFLSYNFYVSSVSTTVLQCTSTLTVNTANTYITNNMYVSSVSTNAINMTNGQNIGPTSNVLTVNTLVSTAKFQVLYDQELQPFKGINGNYLFTKPNSDGYINIGAWSTGTGGPIPLCLQVDSGGSPSGTPVGINTPSPAFTLDVNGNIHASGYLSTNTINMNSGSINSVGGLSVNGPVAINNTIDGGANLSLFNNKAYLTTNTVFDGCFLELANSGPQFIVSGPGASPNYAIIGSTITQITQNKDNGYASLLVYNSGTTNTSAELLLQSARGAYGLYATQSEGGVGGLTASTFQIYSYYNTDGTPVLTIYPNGDTTIPGNLTVNGSAISNVVCSTITSSSPTWSNFYGKYCFVNGDSINSLTLPGSAPNGSVIVIRNIGTTTAISISGTADSSGNSILAGKTSSYVFTTVTGGNNWYAL